MSISARTHIGVDYENLYGMFFDAKRYDFSRVGRFKFNIKLDSDVPVDQKTLSAEDFFKVIEYLMRLHRDVGRVDDMIISGGENIYPEELEDLLTRLDGVVAAAVVGGVRLSGGEGGVGAAVLGALFVTVLSNGMNLVQIDGYLQQICLGVIIIISLIISRDEFRR